MFCDFMPAEYRRYEVKTVQKEADGIFTVRLLPMEGEVPKYEAGQFFMIKNLNLPQDVKPKIKPYSALHPWRADELSFGVKIHAQFSSGMCNLKPGEQVECSGPYGFFVLPKKIEQPIVFIAGSVGITPLITMIEKLANGGHSGEYYLFYSNREESAIAYRKELNLLSEKNENFELIYAMSGGVAIREKNCVVGRITVEEMRRRVPEFDLAHFYMCASKEFLESMQEKLLQAGVGKERVHVEKW